MKDSYNDNTLQPLFPTEKRLANRLKDTVYTLASEIGERNVHTPGTMQKAAEWIEEQMRKAGFRPERDRYETEGLFYGGYESDNLVAEIPGTNQSEKIVVIGAHYDSVSGSPGANDNASAVAVLLVLAEWFAKRPQSKTLRFIAFANEEPPFFHTRNMGSYNYADRCRGRGETITAMMAMDGLGYYSEDPGSQSYPVPGIGFMYPDKADFIGFVTRVRDSGLLRRALGAYRRTAILPSQGAALPGFIPGVFWSDHWSFWKHGYPAFLVTDTLLFRDPEYHTSGDTPDRLDYRRMVRLTEGLKAVIEELALAF